MKKREKATWWYVVSDFIASMLAWYALFLFRKVIIEGHPFNFDLPFQDNKFFIAILILPLTWLLFHYITGTYTDLYKKSRLQEIGKTAIVTFAGCYGYLLPDIIG